MAARQQKASDETGTCRIRVLVGLLVAFAGLCAVAPAAFAGVALSVVPTFPSPVTVGSVSQPASLTITNSSNGTEATGTLTVCAGSNGTVQNTCATFGLPAQSLLVTPSCGSTALGTSCPGGAEDPGVFKLSPTGTGRAGTACAGITFTITTVNATTGQVAFVPSSTIVLAAPGGASGTNVCQIDYTADVLKTPGKPIAGNPRTTVDLASGSAFSNVTSTAATGFGNTTVTVNQAPDVATGAAASVSNTEETIQGSVNPNGSPTSYTVEYGRTLSFGAISQVNAAGSGSTPFTGQVADITGLSPNATYFYRLVASNGVGTSTGTVKTFTTTGPAGGTPPMVTTGAATNITSSSATLSGTISPGGLQTGFTFEYGSTTTFGSITAVNALVPSGVLQPVSLPVSGLLANHFYLYRLVASNSAGTTVGAVMGFTTAP